MCILANEQSIHVCIHLILLLRTVYPLRRSDNLMISTTLTEVPNVASWHTVFTQGCINVSFISSVFAPNCM